jgi:class 3 adenylate cyclase/TolB-like protein/tetratricopeptide (TPR) repeat protein
VDIQNRQLAAILFTDIEGSTAMMHQDEDLAVATARRYMDVLQKAVADCNGQILNDYGDGNLCTFPSANQAVKCALEVQIQLRSDPPVPLRIGLHIGEFFYEGAKTMGDGVNIASRIQSLGSANTILFSREIFDKIRNQTVFKAVSLGMFEFKNVDEPVEVFALANDGLLIPKREEMTGKLKEVQRKSNLRKWLITTAIIALLVAVIFIYHKSVHKTGFSGDEKSVAVLPFENLGSNKSEDYISDGVTQDVINNLSSISSIQKVIGWISVRSFKKTTKSVKDIAEELGVAAILSGTIQKLAEKTMIRAELTEVGTGKQLWGGEFEYSDSDLLSIQSKVVLEIVSALKANLTSQEKVNIAKLNTDNVDAYKLYRRGRTFWDQRTPSSYDSAEVCYKKAIELDTNYALAYAGIADCYTYNAKGLLQTEGIPIARRYAELALQHDSTLIEALATKAFIQSHFDYDWEGSATLFKKIINENPNYTMAHIYYGNVLIAMGKIEAGLSEHRRAVSLEPLSPTPNYVLGRSYEYTKRYDSAIEQLQKAIRLNPSYKLNYMPLAETYIQKKLYSKAIDAFSKLPQGQFLTSLNGFLFQSNTYALAGDTAKAKTLLEKVSSENRLKAPYHLAYVYTSLNEHDSALNQLELAYKTHDIGLILVKLDPIFDPIRNEPRFKELLKKMRLE